MLRKMSSLAALFAAAICVTAPGAQAGGLEKPDTNAPLYNKLPEAIRAKGVIVSATTGRYPPYNYLAADGKTLKGVAIDLSEEMSKILGVPIRNEIADSIASFMTGVQSGRYDFVFGVVADRPERQKAVDMVDWTKQSTAFLVAAGNPKGIKGIVDTCGLRIAVQKASFAEPVLEKQSKICVEEGKPAVDIQILADQATMALAIQSGRIDASFASNAALVYFQSQAHGFEVTGAGDNLMGDLWQASVTPKGSDMTQVILEAWKTMFENGSYKQIMTKWGLKAEMVDAPGINMAK